MIRIFLSNFPLPFVSWEKIGWGGGAHADDNTKYHIGRGPLTYVVMFDDYLEQAYTTYGPRSPRFANLAWFFK